MRKPISIQILVFFLLSQIAFPVNYASAQSMAPVMNPSPLPVNCIKPAALIAASEFEKIFTEAQEQISKPLPNAEVLFNHAEMMVEQKHFQEAIVLYTKVIQLQPDYPNVLVRRGYAYSEIGQWDLAVQDGTENIQKNPLSAKAYFSRGTTYLNKADYELALRDYQNSLLLNPQDKCTQNNIALTYERLNNPGAAFSHYNQALKIDPSFRKALHNRAKLYWRQGAYFRAFFDYVRLGWLVLFKSDK